MLKQPEFLPRMPEIGQPESYYGMLARQADAQGNHYLHEAAKVGQYITLGMEANLNWPAKLRYFQHAFKRHCQPPAVPNEEVWLFYRSMADLVRQYAGQEALKLACQEDDAYAMRVTVGGKKSAIVNVAREFFATLIGDGEKRPEWFNEEDWAQLKLIRNQWVG